jgi:hypothetical protein
MTRFSGSGAAMTSHIVTLANVERDRGSANAANGHEIAKRRGRRADANIRRSTPKRSRSRPAVANVMPATCADEYLAVVAEGLLAEQEVGATGRSSTRRSINA